MVGRLLSIWEGPFSGAMSVLGRVHVLVVLVTPQHDHSRTLTSTKRPLPLQNPNPPLFSPSFVVEFPGVLCCIGAMPLSNFSRRKKTRRAFRLATSSFSAFVPRRTGPSFQKMGDVPKFRRLQIHVFCFYQMNR